MKKSIESFKGLSKTKIIAGVLLCVLVPGSLTILPVIWLIKKYKRQKERKQ